MGCGELGLQGIGFLQHIVHLDTCALELPGGAELRLEIGLADANPRIGNDVERLTESLSVHLHLYGVASGRRPHAGETVLFGETARSSIMQVPNDAMMARCGG